MCELLQIPSVLLLRLLFLYFHHVSLRVAKYNAFWPWRQYLAAEEGQGRDWRDFKSSTLLLTSGGTNADKMSEYHQIY